MGADEPDDLLADPEWTCASSPPGARSGPEDLEGEGLRWMVAQAPGTTAAALQAVGAVDARSDRLDGQDWWYRVRFDGPATPVAHGWVLRLEGLATLADVWLNGRHLLHSESMFATHRIPVGALEARNELCIRFAALDPVLAQRRPRPRWKVRGVSSQNLRWFRTTLLGRQTGWAVIPAPVGPWRPVSLRAAAPVEVVASHVVATCPAHPVGPGPDPGPGAVAVTVEVTGAQIDPDGRPPVAEVRVAGRSAPLDVVVEEGSVVVSGEVHLDEVARWWPHTHGDQPLYPVSVVVGGVVLDLGEVGFRTIESDRTDGGFRLSVNGVPVFCRGACWYPIDPVGYRPSDDEVLSSVDLARTAGMNLLRIPGGTVYEEERFFLACDRAGILVWQDMMLGPVDPPDDQEFLDAMVDEAVSVLDRAAHHPSLAVVCGGQEVEEQPAMFGLPRERWRSPIIHDVLPALLANRYPGLPYVSSSPAGGDLPFQVDAGVSHYFGVGVYLCPLSDLRRAEPRFVSEGLAFSIPPEPTTIEEQFGGDLSTNLESEWKRAVHRDAGSWFDLEGVRDHYAGTLFEVDLSAMWRNDHERALDLGRAAVAEVCAAAVAEWRRPGSSCAGMVFAALRDLRTGPGWGLIDRSGRPKAPWYAVRRCLTPIAVLITDEGVNGLDVHLVNDTADDIDGTLVLSLHTASLQVEQVTHAVVVPARGGVAVRADSLFDGFRDLSYAYCFGPRTYELVTADLVDGTGTVVAGTGHLPGGPARDRDRDVGLQVELAAADGGVWHLSVSSRRFAQYVSVDVPGFVPDDSWFHLAPGASRLVRLLPEAGTTSPPRGRVRALNSVAPASFAP
jgi:beta-mannosidase